MILFTHQLYQEVGEVKVEIGNPDFLPPANVVCAKVMFSQASVILLTGGGVGGFIGGACMVFIRGGHVWFYLGGMHGFIWGGMHGFIRGGAWFYSGGMHVFIWGGMHVFIRWACMVLFGGACVSGLIRGGMCGFIRGGHAWFFQFFRIQWDTVNERAVRILLECILVL